MSTPRLSVVVGSHDARASVLDCLASLVPQCEAGGAELVVVDNSTDGTAPLIREAYPEVRLLSSERAHIPELWAEGIAATSGAIVALTTAHAVPASDWVAQMLRSHDVAHAGVGGVIAQDPAASLADWAVYFCRYHAFLPHVEAAVVPEIAGDNAAYKRAALDAVSETWRHGFWEPPVHAALRANGHTLWRTPDVIVVHRRSLGMGGFLRNRLQHGRQYGRDRAAGRPWTDRAVLAARTPLVPFVLTGRVASAVFRRRYHLGAFVGALPLIATFYVAWAMGELRGILSS